MAKLDITELTKAADDLLRIVENPLHRQILENYRRHSLLEVTGRWQDIFAPDMTVEHPIYFLNTAGSSVTLDGFDEVSGFYRTLVDTGSNVILLEDEQLAVADWGFATEAVFNTFLRGSALPDADADGFYVIRQRIAMHWPYDHRGRMIGEHVYEHVAQSDILEIPEAEFITQEEADRELTPLIRPLTVLPGEG